MKDRDVSLVPFHNLSPGLKSLRVCTCFVPRSRILEFVCSFPLLEDLSVNDMISENDLDQNDFLLRPLTSPAFTGTLEFNLLGWMECTTRLLLSLPNGLHFRKLVCGFLSAGDVLWTRVLMDACSNTLECVDIQVQCGAFLQLSRWDQDLR